MILQYRKGNLFDAPKSEYLAHACNCQGIWGAGVAAQFARRFPDEYKQYQLFCDVAGDKLLGKSLVLGQVICLFTSDGYGAQKDSVKDILENTRLALEHLALTNPSMTHVNSPLINAGLFRVPWDKTAEVIEDSNHGIYWTVWKL